MNTLHYIRAAVKSLLRDKLYSATNIAGLALGIGLSIIILLLIKYELSYDSGIKGSKNIYRLTTRGESPDGIQTVSNALTPLPLSGLLRTFHETEATTRLIPGANKLIKYNSASLKQSRFFFADPSFFNVFELRIIKGSVEQLNKPGNVVITKTLADKYFKGTNPVGKKINRDGIKYNIIAVSEDMPEASHFHFDLIASISTIEKILNYNRKILDKLEHNWKSLVCYTYVKVKPKADLRIFEKHLNKKARLFEERSKPENKTTTATSQVNTTFHFHLQPIRSIHLHSKLDSELEPLSNPFRILIFISITIFILLIISINFINITTAEPSKRLRDAAIRKLNGARSYHIALQIFTEAFIISASATILGLVLAELMIPAFNKLFNLSLKLSQIQGLQDIGMVIFITFIIGIISGGYPAKFFSGIDPVNIFRNRFKLNKSSFIMRGFIIAGQVFVLMFLSVLTAGIWQQLNFISERYPGFNKKNLLIIDRAYTIKQNYEDFKQEIKHIKGVVNVSAATSVPGEGYMKNIFSYRGINPPKKTPVNVNFVDCDYLQTMQLRLMKGSFLNCETKDSMGIILNSTAIKELEIKKPLEEHIETANSQNKSRKFNILGVVGDYNYEPLDKKTEPLGLVLLCKHNFFRYIIIRVEDRKDKRTLSAIRNTWNKYSDNEPLESFFLADRLNDNYKEDSRMLTALMIFTLFSFFISVLGFISYASFLIEYKDKKISLMKTLGIPDNYILRNLIGSFGKYILIGVSLSIPTALMIIRIWLRNFAYTEHVSLLNLLILITLVAGTGIASISYQYFRIVFKKNYHYLTKR